MLHVSRSHFLIGVFSTALSHFGHSVSEKSETLGNGSCRNGALEGVSVADVVPIALVRMLADTTEFVRGSESERERESERRSSTEPRVLWSWEGGSNFFFLRLFV